jgi:methyl-accepting chemotaxis protein
MSNQTRLSDRLAFIELDGSAAKRLKSMKDVLTAALPGALDRFYSKIQAEPATRAVLANPGVLHRTKGRQRAHWDRVAAGRFDHRYLAAVTRVAEAHARIGLEPRWHIGGYAILMEQLVNSIVAERWPKRLLGRRRSGAADVAADIVAVIKAVFLDIDLAVAVYLQAIAGAGSGAAGRAPSEAPMPATEALGTALAALSIGDLTHRIETALPDGQDSLRDDYNLGLDRLQDTVASLADATDGVMVGAEQLANAAADASRRAVKQEAGLRQTAAGLKAVTRSADRVVAAASAVHGTVAGAEAPVEAAKAALQAAAATIAELDHSSGQLAGVMAVIEEIGAHAQMLAMSAGLEAARAGDAGRGFAVIAAEVRALAQRSAVTTRDIKAVVARSGHQAQDGARHVGDGHAALQRMSAEMAEAKAVLAEIAGTAREQERGLRQIGKLAATLEYEARESAGLCQHAAAGGTELADQAAAQLRLVRRFRIARPIAVAAPPKRRPLAVIRSGETPQRRLGEDKRPVVSLRVINGGLADGGAASRRPG